MSKTIEERATELVDGIIKDANLSKNLKIAMRARIILALREQEEITSHACVENDSNIIHDFMDGEYYYNDR